MCRCRIRGRRMMTSNCCARGTRGRRRRAAGGARCALHSVRGCKLDRLQCSTCFRAHWLVAAGMRYIDDRDSGSDTDMHSRQLLSHVIHMLVHSHFSYSHTTYLEQRARTNCLPACPARVRPACAPRSSSASRAGVTTDATATRADRRRPTTTTLSARCSSLYSHRHT